MKHKKQNTFRAVVDRIEGKYIILELEGKAEIIWPAKFLPKGIKPGNILDITFTKNIEAEKKQRKKIRNIQKRLLQKK